MTVHRLDARNLLCPMPVIRTQDMIARLAGGDRLEVVCTDPGARHDVPAWCRVHGHRVVEIAERDGETVITVAVGEGGPGS